MITLHLQFVPKHGKEKELKAAIIDKWMDAMAKQPGFITAIMLTPYKEEELKKLNVPVPKHSFEVISVWKSEEERAAWAARPIHKEVFTQVLDVTETRIGSLQNVLHSWNL
ncbi:MAG: hypothetical protein FJ319_02475 [SAR202 cluster bacterium]|nr:hypothetical protein [SAR202 cluster bacterium]